MISNLICTKLTLFFYSLKQQQHNQSYWLLFSKMTSDEENQQNKKFKNPNEIISTKYYRQWITPNKVSYCNQDYQYTFSYLQNDGSIYRQSKVQIKFQFFKKGNNQSRVYRKVYSQSNKGELDLIFTHFTMIQLFKYLCNRENIRITKYSNQILCEVKFILMFDNKPITKYIQIKLQEQKLPTQSLIEKYFTHQIQIRQHKINEFANQYKNLLEQYEKINSINQQKLKHKNPLIPQSQIQPQMEHQSKQNCKHI